MVLNLQPEECEAIRYANGASYFTIEMHFNHYIGQQGAIPHLVCVETIHCTLDEAEERMRQMAANWRERNSKSKSDLPLFGSIYNTSQAAEDWLRGVLRDGEGEPNKLLPVRELIEL